MNNKSNTLRLLFPQWQGGVISQWFPELSPKDAATGYNLGARLLQFLAPENPDQLTVEVPTDMNYVEEKAEQGISRRKAILKQTQSALEIVNAQNPERIVTFGGECSSSVVPFTYLANKYPDDVAVVWIDAHPDINIPGDEYTGYHAMALTACMGLGDTEIMKLLSTKIDASKILLAGLCSIDDDAKKKIARIGNSTPFARSIESETRISLELAERSRCFKSGNSFRFRCVGSTRIRRCSGPSF
jgi:arginase